MACKRLPRACCWAAALSPWDVLDLPPRGVRGTSVTDFYAPFIQRPPQEERDSTVCPAQPSAFACIHFAAARRKPLLLRAINRPIMLATDLTDFINLAHNQQLPILDINDHLEQDSRGIM